MGHLLPHAPQLLMSFSRFTHTASQQVKSKKPPPPPLELLELPAPPVPTDPPFPPVPMAPPFPPAPVDEDDDDDDVPEPPEPPPWTSDPQPAAKSPIKLKTKIRCCMEPMVSRLQCKYIGLVKTHAPRAAMRKDEGFWWGALSALLRARRFVRAVGEAGGSSR